MKEEFQAQLETPVRYKSRDRMGETHHSLHGLSVPPPLASLYSRAEQIAFLTEWRLYGWFQPLGLICSGLK